MRHWYAFQEDKRYVTEALQKGNFDYMEIIGMVEEMRFFQELLEGGSLERLASEYPTPRVKEEVPLWLYLASELTLRLHGARGFGGIRTSYIAVGSGMRWDHVRSDTMWILRHTRGPDDLPRVQQEELLQSGLAVRPRLPSEAGKRDRTRTDREMVRNHRREGIPAFEGV